jgi:predicted ATPase/class 3 adenylate cyclase
MATRPSTAPVTTVGASALAGPTGTVTFLFSDVEGSTERWERDRAAMAPALARHDELVRAALVARGGYVFKTVGDAFCAAFETAQDAVAAALDAQRALEAEDFSSVQGIRVRMALHTGRSVERDGDYFGPAVNRVARLLAVGHGGQVLVSGVVADLLKGEMPPECSLHDLGAHRLKDLGHPEQVYQLLAPGLPGEFPALKSLDALSHNLAAQLASFVGRDEVIAEIAKLIDQHRLVTLVGTGGAGKTRCAIQVGAELLDGSADGVWLAELAPITDASFVASSVARALSLQESPNRPLIDTLLSHLKRKRLLLILDNCEHVIEEARAVAVAILKACAEVRILATSREGLNTAGEQLYRLPSLSIPKPGHTPSAKELLSYGAPLLFAERALSVNHRFSVTDENAPYILEICRRLDGIPLAIELAAARLNVLTPQRLAQMLDERFRVLTSGSRSALPRHQTMRALIDWSYDLLTEQERALFRRLSIFAGDFTLEFAVAVCSDETVDEFAILDGLSSLVDKSLVHAEMGKAGASYRLLESTRQYARERLIERGEYDAVALAHAAAFLALAEELDRTWETTPDREWFARAQPAIENFRAALSWTLGTGGDQLMGQRLAGALCEVWVNTAGSEGRRWVQAAQELVDDETPKQVVAQLDLAEAQIAIALLQYKASCAAAERALARYRELNDPLRIAYAQRSLGCALLFLGRDAEGEVLLRQALAHGTPRLKSSALSALALARCRVGDVESVREIAGEALAVARSLGATRRAAMVAGNLAEAEFRAEDAERALQLASEALAAYRMLNDAGDTALFLSNIAAYQVALEHYDEARASGREALLVARDAQFEVLMACALQHLAAIGALRPSDEAHSLELRRRAAGLLGFADARLTAAEGLREYTEDQELERMLPALREALGADELARLMKVGSAWGEEHAVNEAMLI